MAQFSPARPVVYGVTGCGQKKLHASVACHQLLSRFLANAHLPQVSHQLSNDKGYNKVEPGAVHLSLGIYLTAEENLRKSLLEDHQMKDEQPVIASKGPLTPNDVSRIAQHVRKGEGRK